MKKGLLLLMASFLAFGVAVKSMASARLDGLAADVREIEDMDLIWLYPNKVLEYKNTVDYRLADNWNGFSNVNNEWGGVIASETGIGVIGAYINRPERMGSAWNNLSNHTRGIRPMHSQTWSNVGNDFWQFGFANGNRSLDLFWADSLSGADLGVHFTYGDGFGPTWGNTGDSQDYGLAIGLGVANVGPLNQLNLHADYQMQTATQGGIHDNGVSSILVGALGQADLSTDNFIRPYLDIKVDSENATDFANVGAAYSWSGWGVMLGASCNHKVNGGKGLISTGLAIDYYGASITDPNNNIFGSYTADQWYVIWNGSVESEVSSWLTLRAGIVKNLFARTYNSDNAVNNTWFDPTNNNVIFNTGFSINWQNFTLDCKVQTASLENIINNPEVGGGIFYPNSNNTGIVVVDTADLKYKF